MVNITPDMIAVGRKIILTEEHDLGRALTNREGCHLLMQRTHWNAEQAVHTLELIRWQRGHMPQSGDPIAKARRLYADCAIDAIALVISAAEICERRLSRPHVDEPTRDCNSGKPQNRRKQLTASEPLDF
jgi:hypothetical protein